MFINNEDIIFDQDDILDQVSLVDYTPDVLKDEPLFKGSNNIFKHLLKKSLKPLGIYQDIPVEITSLMQKYIDPIPSISVADISVFETPTKPDEYTFTENNVFADGRDAKKRWAEFKFRMNKSSKEIVSVGWRTINGTAIGRPINKDDIDDNIEYDYQHAVGSVSFDPTEGLNKLENSVFIEILVDDTKEEKENFFLELFEVKNGKLTTDKVTCVIDEGINDLPEIKIDNSVAVYEGQQSVFKVFLTRPSTTDIEIELFSVDGSASKRFDYDAYYSVSYDGGETFIALSKMSSTSSNVPNKVTIKAGEMEVYVQIQTYADAIAEIDENYYLNVLVTSGNTKNTTAEGQALILNNDIESLLAYYNIFINKKKGTRNIIDFILAFLGVDGKVEEWWERGLKPYEYNITFTKGKTFLRMDTDEVRDIIKIINLFKNERSRLASLSSPACFNLLVLSQMSKLDWTMLSDTPGTPIGLDNITICSIQSYTAKSNYGISEGGHYKLRTSNNTIYHNSQPYGMTLSDYELDDTFDSFVGWCLERNNPVRHVRPYKTQMVWEKISDTLHLSEFGDIYYKKQLSENELSRLNTLYDKCEETSKRLAIVDISYLDNSYFDNGCMPVETNVAKERTKLRDVLFEDRIDFRIEYIHKLFRMIIKPTNIGHIKTMVKGACIEDVDVTNGRNFNKIIQQEVILGPTTMNPSFELDEDNLDADTNEFDFSYLQDFDYNIERGRVYLKIGRIIDLPNEFKPNVFGIKMSSSEVHHDTEIEELTKTAIYDNSVSMFCDSRSRWVDYAWWGKYIVWDNSDCHNVQARFQTVRRYDHNKTAILGNIDIETVHNIYDEDGKAVISNVISIDDVLTIR